MPGRECFHCKQWVERGEAHDCHTTTEAALTRDLPDDLREAWERIREAAAEFGEQRIYASLNSIMFSRKACYCFVRPKSTYLELCIFLGRTLTSPKIKRAMPASKVKVAHLLRITHRDEVEPPITDWMREAYEVSEALSGRAPRNADTKSTKTTKTTKTTKGRKTRKTRKGTRSVTPKVARH